MKKTIYLIFLILFLFIIITFNRNILHNLSAKKNTSKITILYSNSCNNYLEDCKCPSGPNGGIVRRATLIKKLKQKNKNVLLFDTGDMFSVDKDELKSEYTLKCYEYLKYDAICIGDQELVNGIDFFKEKVMKLPIIIANFLICENNVCHLVGNPYKIIKINGIKIGVIGIISKNTFKYYPEEITKNLKIDNPIETINHYLKMLKKECDINILLSHSGLDKDKEFAQQINGFDVIIGGHTQNLIEDKIIKNNTLIVQAGKNAEYLGELNIYYNKGIKKIEHINNTLHLLDEKIADDVYIRKLINEYKSKRKSQIKKNINKYNKKIDIILFYSSECKSCEKVKKKIMPFLEKKYKFNFKIKAYNIEQEKNFIKLSDYREKLKSTSGTIPTLIINNKILSGIEEIQSKLEKEIRRKIGTEK